MELYPDAESHQMADDGVDVDLDLTSDPPRNTDDHEMIEDPDVDAKQGIQLNTGLGSDEQMIDEADQDGGILNGTITNVLSEYDDDLEDFEIAEPTDDPDVAVNDAGHPPQPAENNLTAKSQIFIRQNTDNQSQADHYTYRHQAHDDPNSSGDIQPAVGQDLTDQVDTFRQSSVTASGEFESPVSEAQSSLAESSGIESQKSQGTVAEQPTPSPFGHTHQTQSGVPHTSWSTKATRSLNHVDAQGETTIEISSEEKGNYSTSFADHAGLGDSASPFQLHGKSLAAIASKNQTPTLSSRGEIPHESQVDSAEQVDSVTHGTFEDDAIQETSYLHPVVVLYQENEMHLFPPTQAEQDQNQTYFLSDETLAGGPIGNLFNECRNVLGDSIGDQEELEISFEDLGLSIRESAPDTSNTSLVDIVEVFLHLHYNDGNETPPPMRISLLTNVRFSQKLDHLLNSVAEGKGISQLESEYSAIDDLSPEHPEESGGTQASTQPAEVARTGDAADGNHNDRQIQSSLQDTVTESLIKGSTHNEDQLVGSEEHLATRHATTTIDSSSENSTNLTDDAQLVNGVAALTESYPSTVHTATQLDDTTALWSRPGPEDPTEEHYDEAVAEELSDEEHPFPDENEYTDEQNSAGSSTVQGDDPVDKKRDLLDETNTFDVERGLNQQQLASRPTGDLDAEDLITYDVEEDLEYGDDSGSAARWQDTEEVPFVDTEAGTSRSDAPSQLDNASSHRLVQRDDSDNKSLGYRGLNNNAFDQNDSELYHLETKEIGLEARLGEEANKEALEPTTSTSKKEAEMLNHDPSRTVYQYKELSHARDHNLGIDKLDAANSELSTQVNVLPADDEDEITYEDDNEEEAAAKEPLGVSAGPALEQAASSSPGALKRARDDADIADPGDDQGEITLYAAACA
ncbi:MAG: hypothetical protein Q9179_002545 [Wetmoreana sp. 5 TL-2023]